MGETAATPEVQAGQFQNPTQQAEAVRAHGEIPTEERRRLEAKTTPQLEAQLGKETDRLQQLMNQAKQLQKDLASKTEPEQIQIRERIGKLLDQIEKEDTGGARFGVDVYELRIEVARSIKMDSITDARSFLDKAKWATPSWKGFEAAVREMDGDFLKGIGLLAKYISDLFYVLGFDRFLGKASEQAVAQAPAPAPSPAELNPRPRQQRDPEKPPAADRLALSLSTIEDPQTSTQDPSSIFFRAQIGTTAYELKIQPNGENLSWKNTKGEWKKFEFQGDENLSLIEYLKNHQQDIHELTAKIKGAENDDHVRSKLVVAMLKAQKIENTKKNPIDVIVVMSRKLQGFREGSGQYMTTDQIREKILNSPEEILRVIQEEKPDGDTKNPENAKALEQYQSKVRESISKIEIFFDQHLTALGRTRKGTIDGQIRELRSALAGKNTISEWKGIIRYFLDAVKRELETDIPFMGKTGAAAFGHQYPEFLRLLGEAERTLL